MDWFRESIRNRYSVKVEARLGPDVGDDRDVTILNRGIQWDKSGLSYVADQRHAEVMIRDLGLSKHSTAAPSPFDRHGSSEETSEEELLGPEATRYRAVVARGNYLSQNRTDITVEV